MSRRAVAIGVVWVALVVTGMVLTVEGLNLNGITSFFVGVTAGLLIVAYVAALAIAIALRHGPGEDP